MIYVYVIESTTHKFRYVGITSDVTRRLKEHNNSKNLSTSFYKPFKLVYTENYPTYKEARVREKFLKSGKGRAFLNTIV